MVLYSLNRSLKVRVRVNVPVPVRVKVDTLYLVCSRSIELMQSMVLYSLNRSLKVPVKVRVKVRVKVPVPVKVSVRSSLLACWLTFPFPLSFPFPLRLGLGLTLIISQKFSTLVLKFFNFSIFICIFAPDIVHISNESTGQKPSCRGGNSLNYTLLGKP